MKNTPDYILKARHVCVILGIKIQVSPYEADPQAAYIGLHNSLIPVKGDSYFFAYGVISKLIIVKDFYSGLHRVIDLAAHVEPGHFPLLHLCVGCDLTDNECGVLKGISYVEFIKLVEGITDFTCASSRDSIYCM